MPTVSKTIIAICTCCLGLIACGDTITVSPRDNWSESLRSANEFRLRPIIEGKATTTVPGPVVWGFSVGTTVASNQSLITQTDRASIEGGDFVLTAAIFPEADTDINIYVTGFIDANKNGVHDAAEPYGEASVKLSRAGSAPSFAFEGDQQVAVAGINLTVDDRHQMGTADAPIAIATGVWVNGSVLQDTTSHLAFTATAARHLVLVETSVDGKTVPHFTTVDGAGGVTVDASQSVVAVTTATLSAGERIVTVKPTIAVAGTPPKTVALRIAVLPIPDVSANELVAIVSHPVLGTGTAEAYEFVNATTNDNPKDFRGWEAVKLDYDRQSTPHRTNIQLSNYNLFGAAADGDQEDCVYTDNQQIDYVSTSCFMRTYSGKETKLHGDGEVYLDVDAGYFAADFEKDGQPFSIHGFFTRN